MERTKMKNTMQKVMWAIAAAIFCILVVHTPAQAMMTEDQADGKSILMCPKSASLTASRAMKIMS